MAKKLRQMKSVFCLAGTSSGTGKTILTNGLLAALKRRAIAVQPFKCGPDYIDPGFHLDASGTISRNLDLWMMGEEGVKHSFYTAMNQKSCGVIEGVMGMFDGASATSIEGSSADLAIKLGIPIVLIVNAKGVAGTIAAIVKGFVEFSKDVHIMGIIANQVNTKSHAAILADALKASNLPPLLGYFPRDERWILPERHLGLVPNKENKKSELWYNELAEAIETYINVDKILELSKIEIPNIKKTAIGKCEENVTLAIAKDEAFHFYYQDNLDLLEESGIKLLPFSPIHDTELPKHIDGIYIGGGFPEMFAKELAKNKRIRQQIKNFSEKGKFIFAECGGLMYLSQHLTCDGEIFDMCGVLPCKTEMNKRLRRLGYRDIRLLETGCFGEQGTQLRGHEFHWSTDIPITDNITPAWEVKGLRGKREWTTTGYHLNKNTWASYIHIHFYSNPDTIKHLLTSLTQSTEFRTCNN